MESNVNVNEQLVEKQQQIDSLLESIDTLEVKTDKSTKEKSELNKQLTRLEILENELKKLAESTIVPQQFVFSFSNLAIKSLFELFKRNELKEPKYIECKSLIDLSLAVPMVYQTSDGYQRKSFLLSFNAVDGDSETILTARIWDGKTQETSGKVALYNIVAEKKALNEGYVTRKLRLLFNPAIAGKKSGIYLDALA